MACFVASEATIASNAYGLQFLVLLVTVIAALALGVAFLVALGVNVWHRRWRRVVSIIAVPVLVGGIVRSAAAMGIDSDVIHLQLSRSVYLAAVARLPAAEVPKLVCWDWGSRSFFGGGQISWTLVYDDKDEIALPKSAWTPAWTNAAERTLIKPCGLYFVIDTTDRDFSVRHLGGHFYLVRQVDDWAYRTK